MDDLQFINHFSLVESENNESENEEIHKLIVYPRALSISNQTRSKFFVEVKTAR
jgi:hypothetical protein